MPIKKMNVKDFVKAISIEIGEDKKYLELWDCIPFELYRSHKKTDEYDFNDGKIIFIFRNPFDTILSTQDYYGRKDLPFLSNWIDYMNSWADKIRSEDVLVIQYENLLFYRRWELIKILTFIESRVKYNAMDIVVRETEISEMRKEVDAPKIIRHGTIWRSKLCFDEGFMNEIESECEERLDSKIKRKFGPWLKYPK